MAKIETPRQHSYELDIDARQRNYFDVTFESSAVAAVMTACV